MSTLRNDIAGHVYIIFLLDIGGKYTTLN